MDINQEDNHQLKERGYLVKPGIYTQEEIDMLMREIDAADQTRHAFRKHSDLFAIRRFFKELPSAAGVIFNAKLRNIINDLFGEDYFVVKAIYFDKPGQSNWFVAYHQDLTVAVDQKIELDGFGPWTSKMNQFAVQPPVSVLEDNFTIRIHLDETDEKNGALKVYRGSHHWGIFRPENLNPELMTEDICCVPAGGIMVMRPLLLHSSARTTDNRKRRVVHIEFSRSVLPSALNWAEEMQVSNILGSPCN